MNASIRIKTAEYRNALASVLKCKPLELKVKRMEHGSAVGMHQDNCYKIYHLDDMVEYSNTFFQTNEDAILIPDEIWIEVAEEVHTKPKFYEKLLQRIPKDEYAGLNLALSISQMCGKDAGVFWNTLNSVNDFDLYSSAVLAASETYNKGELENDILEIMIANGETYFNQLIGGIFETVEVKDGKLVPDESNEEGEIFYVFSVDPIVWEEK